MVNSLPTGPEPAGSHAPKLVKPLRTFGPSKRSNSASSSPKSLIHSARKSANNESRRSQSLSPSKQRVGRPSSDQVATVPVSCSLPVTHEPENLVREETKKVNLHSHHNPALSKHIRALTTKKRDFFKLRKEVLLQQNILVGQFASIKEAEKSLGHVGDDLGDLRIVAVSTWPVHDLLLLVRDEIKPPMCNEVGGVIGPEILQQIHNHLSPLPFEIGNLGRELLERRYALIVTIRGKHRSDRAISASEWKAKNADLDVETEELTKMLESTVSSVKNRVQASFDLARNAWIDRDILIKKLEKAQRDVVQLQTRAEKMHDKEKAMSEAQSVPAIEPAKGPEPAKTFDCQSQDMQTLFEELQRERAQKETQKEMLASAESMLRSARNKIVSLERQLKETRTELEAAHRKQKELEQMHRHRETNIDARSKKLMEVSKTGELTIEQLQRQRDALEMRVKELRESAAREARSAAMRNEEQRSRADNLHAKVARQGKELSGSQKRTQELEARVKELEEQIQGMRERSAKLLEMSKQRCADLLPNKESEPTERETELWKTLQVTRAALSKAEEELQRCRADKDSFLNSLSRIAGEGSDNLEDKMATELLERERKICRLKEKIREHEQNEKSMEQSMTQYENQLAGMKLEIKKLRSYYHYVKEVPHQELQAELLELQMQVSALRSQRTALVSAAASRALMLERHERAAECFARVTRTRHELAALASFSEPLAPSLPDVSHSLSAIRSAGAETWSALKSERNRVLSLERAVLSQNLQLEREGRVRTQLERRRAFMERELMWPRQIPNAKYVPSNRLDMLSMGSRTTSSGRSYE